MDKSQATNSRKAGTGKSAIGLVAIVIIAYIVMAIIAVPTYAYKGEQYQENVDYNLDDVKAVEGKDDKNEER